MRTGHCSNCGAFVTTDGLTGWKDDDGKACGKDKHYHIVLVGGQQIAPMPWHLDEIEAGLLEMIAELEAPLLDYPNW